MSKIVAKNWNQQSENSETMVKAENIKQQLKAKIIKTLAKL